jgi:MOSC domain-containing protein YiiM
MPARLASVNVGTPVRLLTPKGRQVRTAIFKQPVAGRVAVREENLEGDAQADRRVHGGPDKAVYAYAAEDTAWWERELGRELGPGAFGENLTILGATESDACVGDVWRWGDALLQISEPRGPCYKLTLHRREERMIDLVNESGRTGWLLRVLRPGRVPVRGPIEVAERHPARVSVLDVHRAWRRKDGDELRELLHLDPLGSDLKQMIRNVLARRGARA